ncbi:MAG: diaminopimelate epimerase [Lachnospiraceae bacterium]|nr:diaminopimelate epimerase [Lachnospiraceae bacterium]
MKFTKMHGLGNDYIYVNGFEEKVKNKSKAAKLVSDRHFGIGSDGLIFINPSRVADFEMEMYNSDGSRAEMCGNGIRCVAKYVYDFGLTEKTEISIETLGGIKYLNLNVSQGRVKEVTVDMGEPELVPANIPVISKLERVVSEDISVDGKVYQITAVSMGNPHAVVFYDGIDKMEIEKLGPKFENHNQFPNRINTEFVEVLDREHVSMRVWERGAGETLACGTGACAVTVACILNGLTESEVRVTLLGGDLLIQWNKENNRVYMTGPAETVFTGEIDLEESCS